jgi:hypothetical protein
VPGPTPQHQPSWSVSDQFECLASTVWDCSNCAAVEAGTLLSEKHQQQEVDEAASIWSCGRLGDIAELA